MIIMISELGVPLLPLVLPLDSFLYFPSRFFDVLPPSSPFPSFPLKWFQSSIPQSLDRCSRWSITNSQSVFFFSNLSTCLFHGFPPSFRLYSRLSICLSVYKSVHFSSVGFLRLFGCPPGFQSVFMSSNLCYLFFQ